MLKTCVGIYKIVYLKKPIHNNMTTALLITVAIFLLGTLK